MSQAKKKKLYVGIDLGGTNLKAGLLDAGHKVLHRLVLKTGKFPSKEDLISGIVRCTNKIIKDNGLSTSDISAVGLGLPGPVDHERGIVHFLPNIPGWSHVPLKNILQKKLFLPVFLDNDVKIITLAEQMRGRAKFSNCLCVTLGTGVGGGLILRGELYRGKDNAAGEIGHVPVSVSGPRCNCGGRGCLEAYVGNRVILKKAKSVFGRQISLEELAQLADRGNRKARGIWHEAGLYLGVALSGAITLLNLDAVIIGGGVSGAGRALFSPLKKTVRERAMSVQARRVRILRAGLGKDAGIIGAAILAQDGAVGRQTFPEDYNKALRQK